MSPMTRAQVDMMNKLIAKESADELSADETLQLAKLRGLSGVPEEKDEKEGGQDEEDLAGKCLCIMNALLYL